MPEVVVRVLGATCGKCGDVAEGLPGGPSTTPQPDEEWFYPFPALVLRDFVRRVARVPCFFCGGAYLLTIEPVEQGEERA